MITKPHSQLKPSPFRPTPSMAQFTTRGSIKPPFDTDNKRRPRLDQKGILLCYDKFSTLSRNKPKRLTRCNSRSVSSSASSAASSSLNGLGTTMNSESSDGYEVDGDYDGVYEVCYDDNFEFHKDDFDCFRGLVLDVSYRPINVVCWRRAICLEFLDKADVLEYYDQTVNSPSGSFYIPAVLRIPHLLTVVKRRRVKSTLSRKNILYRDNYTCQYCSSRENLTIDHVLPIARGGVWKWENLVTACSRCNSRKGQKTVEEANMKLMKVPKPSKDFDIVAIPLTNKAIQRLRMGKGTPEEWHQYLARPSAEP